MTHTTANNKRAVPHVSDTPQSEGLLLGIGLAFCAILLCARFAILRRININWDEFHFLSDVYELVRGQLTVVMQSAYTHLFRWLTLLPQDEIGQIVSARVVMFGFLLVTCLLIWKLASVWVPRSTAVIAPLCYLSMLPIAKHGASFRYDPMLAAISVGTLLLIARPSITKNRLIAAGVCMGVGYALTSKAVLLVPAILALLVLNRQESSATWGSVVRASATVAAAATLTGATMLALHQMWVLPAESGVDFALKSVRKTLLEPPFVPQRDTFYALAREDTLAWLLLAAGAFVSIAQRAYRPAFACALSLLPVLFYRNSFSYYYVVMLAPACVLAAVAMHSVQGALASRTHAATLSTLAATLMLALSAQGLLHLYYLRHDDIERQQAVLDAVHSVFPSPVPYIDHSGSVASFKKANFFMSSWGLDRYRAKGSSFILEAIEKHRPPLLLVNTPILDPHHPWSELLLPIDRALIEQFYPQYWGPIRVAGAEIELLAGSAVSLRVPFPDTYRLEAGTQVLVDGLVRKPGDVIHILGPDTEVALQLDSAEAEPSKVRLIWAGAQAAPLEMPPFRAFYTPL